MTTTPAQVANDLEAQADFFRRRDDHVESICRDAARAIRTVLAGARLSDEVYAGIDAQLIKAIDRYRHQPASQIHKSMSRGHLVLRNLRNGAES